MNSRDLVRCALSGGQPPRVPTGPLAVHFCAGLAGYSLREYSLQAGALADSVLRYYERFHPDAVWISADTWVSAEAMGARVAGTDDDQPLGGVGSPLIQEPKDIDKIPLADAGRGRYPVMLEALNRVRRGLGDEVFVVACFDQYPFSLAAALMGVESLMLRLRDDPAFVEALMLRCEEYGLVYGQALAELKPDLLSGGDSPAGLVGPSAYSMVALPAEQRLIARLKRATDVPVSLHICGNSTRLLSLMTASGADVLEIDHATDLGNACRAVGPGIGLWGNLDPVRVLAQGTAEEVRVARRAAIEAAAAMGHRRFVLSSGCTLAVETPAENLQALLHP